MQFCGLGPDGLLLLAKEVLLNRHVKTLDLKGNDVCGPNGGALDGLIALLDVYAPRGGRSGNTVLTRLGLAHNR